MSHTDAYILPAAVSPVVSRRRPAVLEALIRVWPRSRSFGQPRDPDMHCANDVILTPEESAGPKRPIWDPPDYWRRRDWCSPVFRSPRT